MAEQYDGSYRLCSYMELITSTHISLFKANHLPKPASVRQGNKTGLLFKLLLFIVRGRQIIKNYIKIYHNLFS